MASKKLTAAIQDVSMVFALRVKFLTQKRGWVTNSEIRTTRQKDETANLLLTITTTRLPGGVIAHFIPREAAEPDGKSWVIDVQRTDGVLRRAWVDGLHLVDGQGGHVLHFQDTLLTDEAIYQLLENLGLPAPAGPVRAISQAWTQRFGTIPVWVTDRLEKTSDMDALDQLQAAILSSANVEVALKSVEEILPSELKEKAKR